MTGDGMRQFLEAVEASREEYEKYVPPYLRIPANSQVYIIRSYLPDLERARVTREKTLQAQKDESMNRLMKDLAVDRAKNPEAAKRDRWEEEEDDDDDGDDGPDVDIIDRSKFPIFLVRLGLFSSG